MTGRRVAVTGVGVVCALGNNTEEFRRALASGTSGIRPLAGDGLPPLRFRNGAQVTGFDPAAHFADSQRSMLDRFAQFGVVAAREAVAASGLRFTDGLKARSAVVTGSCVGGQTAQDHEFVQLYRQGRDHVHPFTIPRTMSNAAASAIAMELGLTGPVFNVSTACSSANHAIGQAFWMVRSGMAEAAVCGGCEAPFSCGFLKAWEALRVVSPDTCRPFCRDRNGMILGEGGAMLVLEPLEAAQARGAKILGEVVGFGMTADAYHLTQPSVEGPARAMSLALADAGLDPAQVGYINAHGTGTQANDPTEVKAIRQVFGGHAKRLAVSSTKSMHGHALGAAGAIEAIATLLALGGGVLPPTANFTTADPECDLDFVPNQARRAKVECALSNSFAFGGLNAVLAFRRAG